MFSSWDQIIWISITFTQFSKIMKCPVIPFWLTPKNALHWKLPILPWRLQPLRKLYPLNHSWPVSRKLLRNPTGSRSFNSPTINRKWKYHQSNYRSVHADTRTWISNPIFNYWNITSNPNNYYYGMYTDHYEIQFRRRKPIGPETNI